MTNETSSSSSSIILLLYENNNDGLDDYYKDNLNNDDGNTIGLIQKTNMTISSIYNSLINEPNQMIDDGNHHHHNLLNLLSTNQTSTTAATISTTAMINELNNVLNNQYDRNEFYGEIFHRLNYEYRNIHGYLSLVVCVFGIIANVLNIIVLTRFVIFSFVKPHNFHYQSLFICLMF